MVRRDKGFVFESVYGCERSETFSPHVLLRVELRSVENDPLLYKFVVFVDFHLPVKADVESAEVFDKMVRSAVKKAKWARDVVAGLEWRAGEL
jgi:hypothetical protein